MFRLIFTLSIALMLFFPSQPRAETNPETAQKLTKMFTAMLDDYTAKAEKRGFTLMQDGQVMVEPADERYYAVTLPSLSLKYPEGDTLKIGMIAANVLPTEEPDEWKISMAVPTPIIFYNDLNTPKMRIHIGSQHFSGIWNERLNSYSKFDGRYQDIKVEGADIETQIIIPAIALSADLTETKENIWSGDARYSATGTHVLSGDKKVVSIGNIEMAVDIFDYAAMKAQDYQGKLQSLTESIDAGDTANKESPLHVVGLYNLLSNVIGDIWDGFSIKFFIEDIEILTEPKSTAKEIPEKISLKEVGGGFFMKGFNQDSVTLRAQGHYDGLEVSPPSPRYDGTAPDHMNFDVSINKLPYRKLVELGQQTLKKAKASGKMSKFAGIQALAIAPQILSDAGTYLHIKESKVGNEDYHIIIEGQAKTNMEAMMGGTANMQAEIFGIDTILEHFSRNLQNPDITEEQRATIEKNIQSLEMIKRMGLQTQNDQGKFVMEYDFKLTKEGQLMLNGRNLASEESPTNETPAQSK